MSKFSYPNTTLRYALSYRLASNVYTEKAVDFLIKQTFPAFLREIRLIPRFAAVKSKFDSQFPLFKTKDIPSTTLKSDSEKPRDLDSSLFKCV